MEYAQMSFEERKKVWLEISDITEEEFDALYAEETAAQARVPQPGTEARGCEIDMVDRDRKWAQGRARLAGRTDSRWRYEHLGCAGRRVPAHHTRTAAADRGLRHRRLAVGR